MPAKFLLDECVEAVLLELIGTHNRTSPCPIEAIRVGDRPDLPLGTRDPELLRWAQKNGCIIVSRDVSTLRTHFGIHLAAGGHCPGLFLIRGTSDFHAIVELLAVAADSSDASEWRDLIEFI